MKYFTVVFRTEDRASEIRFWQIVSPLSAVPICPGVTAIAWSSRDQLKHVDKIRELVKDRDADTVDTVIEIRDLIE